nr:MAG TPA: hypothetical protein [Caudoviricetes sp.]
MLYLNILRYLSHILPFLFVSLGMILYLLY